MSVDLKQHVHLKIELDGTGRIGMFEGDFRSCLRQGMEFLLEPTTRWERRTENKEMIWTFRNTPFLAATKDEESHVRTLSEVVAGLDLEGVEQTEDEE